jgi:hypothetical protein
MEEVEVRTTAAGIPTAVIRKGRAWAVGAEPVRWYERRPWWEQSARMPIGGPSRIDVEVWQVQVRQRRADSEPLVTLELVHDRDSGAWHIRDECTI